MIFMQGKAGSQSFFDFIQIWRLLLRLEPKVGSELLKFFLASVSNKLGALGVSYVFVSALKAQDALFYGLWFLGFKVMEWLFFVLQDKYFIGARVLVAQTICPMLLQTVLSESSKASPVERLRDTDVRNEIRNFIGFSLNHLANLVIELMLAGVLLVFIGGTALAYALGVFALSIIGLFAIGSWVYRKSIEERSFVKLREEHTKLLDREQDFFSKLWLARSFGSVDFFLKERRRVSEGVLKRQWDFDMKRLAGGSLMFAFSGAMFVLLYAFSVQRVEAGTLEPSHFAAVMMIALGVFWKLQKASYIFESLYEHMSVLQKALARLEGRGDEDSQRGLYEKKAQEISPADLRVEHVDFYYEEGSMILSNVSFSIRQGECLFVVGASGSGKSTLLRLLLGEERAQRGALWWGGASLLPGCASWVPQDVQWRGGSVAFNLLLGNMEATEEQMMQVLERVKLSHRITREDLKKEGVGRELSGGELQRVGIARALLSGRLLMLLDEPTSALDVHTERALLEELMQGQPEVTKIIVIHRVLAIPKDANCLVLEGGRVVQEGTCEALKKLPGVFSRLCEDAQYD